MRRIELDFRREKLILLPSEVLEISVLKTGVLVDFHCFSIEDRLQVCSFQRMNKDNQKIIFKIFFVRNR